MSKIEKLELHNEVAQWEDEQEFEASQIRDIDESFIWLKNHLENYKEFGAAEESFAVSMSHMGFGMWIRNTLGFWDDLSKEHKDRCELVKWFNDRGIFHPDDMSSIIMVSFHRHLNKKDIRLDEQIQHTREYWDKTDPKVNDGLLG